MSKPQLVVMPEGLGSPLDGSCSSSQREGPRSIPSCNNHRTGKGQPCREEACFVLFFQSLSHPAAWASLEDLEWLRGQWAAFRSQGRITGYFSKELMFLQTPTHAAPSYFKSRRDEAPDTKGMKLISLAWKIWGSGQTLEDLAVWRKELK